MFVFVLHSSYFKWNVNLFVDFSLVVVFSDITWIPIYHLAMARTITCMEILPGFFKETMNTCMALVVDQCHHLLEMKRHFLVMKICHQPWKRLLLTRSTESGSLATLVKSLKPPKLERKVSVCIFLSYGFILITRLILIRQRKCVRTSCPWRETRGWSYSHW